MRKRKQPAVGATTFAFTIESFALAHNLGRNTVLEELSSGRLKARKVRGRTIITAEDAKEWRGSLPLRGEAVV
jgi:hypothetical protein